MTRTYVLIPQKKYSSALLEGCECFLDERHQDSKIIRMPRSVARFVGSVPWTCQRCSRGRHSGVGYDNINGIRATNTRLYTSYRFQLKACPTSGAFAPYSTSQAWPSSSGTINIKSKRRRRLLILAALLGATSAFAFTDTVQHSYKATVRSLRVVYALFRSVTE